MKYIFIFLSIILLSCSRDPVSSNTEISFDLNGQHYAHTGQQSGINNAVGVFAIKTAMYYSFSGYTNTGNLLQLLIVTDSLKPISYKALQGSQIIANGQTYSIASNALNITITSFSGGIVNGTFSGQAATATVTNGQIKNVKMHY